MEAASAKTNLTSDFRSRISKKGHEMIEKFFDAIITMTLFSGLWMLVVIVTVIVEWFQEVRK